MVFACVLVCVILAQTDGLKKLALSSCAQNVVQNCDDDYWCAIHFRQDTMSSDDRLTPLSRFVVVCYCRHVPVYGIVYVRVCRVGMRWCMHCAMIDKKAPSTDFH